MSTLLKRILTIQGARLFLALGALLVLPVMATAAEAPRAGGELSVCRGRNAAVVRRPPGNHFRHAASDRTALQHIAALRPAELPEDRRRRRRKMVVLQRWPDAHACKFARALSSMTARRSPPKTSKRPTTRSFFLPEGVASARKALYAMVDKVEAPDDFTVVFKLKHIAASFLANLASPWNFIYSAERLKKDPRWYEKNVMGSGPFIFGEHVAGSHWVGKKNPNYFMPGSPISMVSERSSSATRRREWRRCGAVRRSSSFAASTPRRATTS